MSETDAKSTEPQDKMAIWPARFRRWGGYTGIAAWSALVALILVTGFSWAGDWWQSRDVSGEIVSPRPDSLVARSISVDAVVNNIPDDSEVWVFVAGAGDGFPQVNAALDRTKSQQIVRFRDVTVGGIGESGEWTVYLVKVDPKAQLKIDQYLQRTAAEAEPQGLGFPDGALPLAGVTVRRDADLQDPVVTDESAPADSLPSSTVPASSDDSPLSSTVPASPGQSVNNEIAQPEEGAAPGFYNVEGSEAFFVTIQGTALEPRVGRALWLFSKNQRAALFPQSQIDPDASGLWQVADVFAFAKDASQGATNSFLLVEVPNQVVEDLKQNKFNELLGGLPEDSVELDSVTILCCE